MSNEQTNADDLTTNDGRKIIQFATAGESYSVETTEQTERGKSAKVETELQAVKLQAVRRGLLRVKL